MVANILKRGQGKTTKLVDRAFQLFKQKNKIKLKRILNIDDEFLRKQRFILIIVPSEKHGIIFEQLLVERYLGSGPLRIIKKLFVKLFLHRFYQSFCIAPINKRNIEWNFGLADEILVDDLTIGQLDYLICVCKKLNLFDNIDTISLDLQLFLDWHAKRHHIDGSEIFFLNNIKSRKEEGENYERNKM